VYGHKIDNLSFADEISSEFTGLKISMVEVRDWIGC